VEGVGASVGGVAVASEGTTGVAKAVALACGEAVEIGVSGVVSSLHAAIAMTASNVNTAAKRMRFVACIKFILLLSLCDIQDSRRAS
jgi:hypothetical protein